MPRPRLAVAALSAATLLSGAAPVGRLDIAIDHLRSARGMLRVCLTADPDNFPACVDDTNAVTRSVPASEHLMRFDGLPSGRYAFAVIHDENGNRRLDTFVGIPREGFGFSRNPRIGAGAPRFASAAFVVAGDAQTQQVVIHYIL